MKLTSTCLQSISALVFKLHQRQWIGVRDRRKAILHLKPEISMASFEMLRSQKTFQQWAMLDRSKLYVPETEQKDWPAADEEKQESGVELRLGLGLGGSTQCKIREGSSENEWIDDAASSKRLKLRKPGGGLEAAIKLFVLDHSLKEIKAANYEAGQNMVDLAMYRTLPLPDTDGSRGGVRMDAGPWTYGAHGSSSGDLFPVLSVAHPDSKGRSQIPANPNFALEYKSGESHGCITNCAEPLKESRIQEALIEQHRFARGAHIQKQQLARKKRKMLIDEQKLQKKGKEDERATLIPRFGRPGSSAWARCWPKEVEKAVMSYGDQKLDSDQQLDKLDRADQVNQGKMEIDGEGLTGSQHSQFLTRKNASNGDVENQRVQLDRSANMPDPKQGLNCHTPHTASILLQYSGDPTKEDDQYHASSQRRGGKEHLWEHLPTESKRIQPLHKQASSVAEITNKQDDLNTLSVPSATTSNTFAPSSYFGNNTFLRPASIPVLPYPYQIPVPSGSGLPFPATFPYPHLMQMLRLTQTDAQRHGRLAPSLPPSSGPFELPAAPSCFPYQGSQNQSLSMHHPTSSQLSSPLSKIQTISSEDPTNILQTRNVGKERSRPGSPQTDPSDNIPCVSQSQASTSGSIQPTQRGSSDPSKKTTNHKSGDQPLSRERSANSAFTSLIAAVKASQGLSAAIAAISNCAPIVNAKSQMVLSSASQVRNGVHNEKVSEKSQSEKPSDIGRMEASGILIHDKEVLGLLGISQLGTTKDIPGIESLAKEPYNLRLGFASEQTFGGTGSSPDLPWVSTTGDGQNGKPVSGVVYRRHQGSMQIVCACHGKHMSPGEFVQHAGPIDMPNA
ncbi:hypothetical protein O6H91_07G042300 [Diphasiastrum complanatum]|uniref:Uncharacterized protein n=1 Tax=Diphasiastrum complanatum TaxID=34168 RepID=A0ACC2D4H5_DIPCM|nr:hypothetical protein O6H91_07G042300 [Diphasiastrum complanatum]